ncbi:MULTISPECIES: FGGY-family carbohydrate kinase [Roseobacteraceae]|uniref:L-xylulose/3-keto-L-gulonate kinase n=1 Tax=Pseudosulfitobacter pseudonitzschiae TaxID=1402135 RepID=A0A221JXV6_9RHOB|nr:MULTISPECIES: FGGY-family carbohydrate kinase [Roseobacteraceae]ASM71581.1 L-xylulose/3-keto-L-gulonate kinase [Pseudosulfitobacter pseudonitzschiae]
MAKAGDYLLGLDAGNTVIKAVLFDLSGRQIALSVLDGKSSLPAPGHVERDLNELWSNARHAIRDCIAKAGIAPEQIRAIGCAGHGNGLYLVDAAGDPVVGIQSLDTRAADLARELDTQVGAALHPICLQRPWPSQTPVLLAWIKRHRPDLYARAATVMLCKDYLTFRLTGNRRSEISDMSGCGLLRMPECTYDSDLMALYGLQEAQALLPELIDPVDLVGSVSAETAAATGLMEGTPVIAGYFDVVSSAMGSGVVRSGEASVIVGTWNINQVFSAAPVQNENVFMVAGFGKERFLNIESSATSAANLEWYVREFIERGGHQDDPFGYCNAKVSEVSPSRDDPIFHPFLHGSRQGAEFRAGFYGVAGWHGEGHLLRALFEGVMFEHRRHIEVLRAAGVRFEQAALSGGGARSPVWPQIFADGLGVPVRVAEAQETGALGAAIGAGVGVGIVPDYEAGIIAMVRPRAEFFPDPAMAEHYDTRYRRYLALRDALAPIWANS